MQHVKLPLVDTLLEEGDFYSILDMKGKEICQWLIVGSLEQCGKSCLDTYCGVHRMRLRKIIDHTAPMPCRLCGVGTQSEPHLCKSCGAEKVKKHLIRAEAKAKRLFPNVMSELHVRSAWAKRLPTFVGL